MHKKLKKWIVWGAMLLVAGGSFAATSQPDFLLGKNIQILFNMFRDVSLFYVDSVDADRLLENAAAGMVSELDPYTELIPEKEMADFEIQATGKYAGIGAIIRKSGDYVMIAQPYKNFPADKAGLVVGDVIVAINGESIKGYDATKVSDMLKGTPGTSVKLTVEKLLTGEQEEVEIKRERIVISGVPYYGVIDGNVGYILHNDFSEDCSQDVLAAFEALKKQGITSLIIDLRGNGGGILQEAVKILSMFVPKGTTVVSMKGRSEDSNEKFVTTTDPVDTEIPIAVLVNSMTASAAEIVSGALQDLDRAVLVGQRTFGKGLVQVTRPLGYNAYLKVTTAKYYIPSGRCIQSVDYAHRNEDGSVGMVPDSLIKEYKTVAGRKVYDGGGIMPDVRLDPNYTSIFTMSLYAKGYSWADMTSVVDSVDRGEFAKNLRPFADLSPIEAFLEQYLEGDFSSLALPFACCATDGGSNECVVLREGKLARALTASSAIPPFFRGVDIGGRKYYDGAFSNAVPADVCREMGAEVVVGIDLSAYARADAEKGRVERWVGSVVGAITPVRTLEDAKTRGYRAADVMLRPNLYDFRATSIDRAAVDAMFEIGYMEAKSRMEEIRKAIADVQKNKPRRRLK